MAYKYKIELDYSPVQGRIEVYVQYINSNVYEFYAYITDINQLFTGYIVEVDTKVINIKLVNGSQCCSFDQTINYEDFN